MRRVAFGALLVFGSVAFSSELEQVDGGSHMASEAEMERMRAAMTKMGREHQATVKMMEQQMNALKAQVKRLMHPTSPQQILGGERTRQHVQEAESATRVSLKESNSEHRDVQAFREFKRMKRAETVVDCSWARKNQRYSKKANWRKRGKKKFMKSGDRRSCFGSRQGPVICHDPTHRWHYWSKKNCKAMCNPSCVTKTRGCPLNNKKIKDKKSCNVTYCNKKTPWYKWATKFCRKTCNPDCNPKLRHIGYSRPTYIPGAVLSPGHRNCADKYTVQTRPGETKNQDKPTAIHVAVCGKCKNKSYVLHPSFVVGHRVFGVCEKVENHDLWHETSKLCNDKDNPCKGEVFRKCQEFMGGWGLYNNKFALSHGYNSQMPKGGRAIAFTCGRVYAFDYSDNSALSFGVDSCTGHVYRVVQSSLISCYSTNEVRRFQQTMECVNRKITKVCVARKLDMGSQPTQKGCYASFAKKQPVAFKDLDENGVGTQWTSCSELNEKEGTAMS